MVRLLSVPAIIRQFYFLAFCVAFLVTYRQLSAVSNTGNSNLTSGTLYGGRSRMQTVIAFLLVWFLDIIGAAIIQNELNKVAT